MDEIHRSQISDYIISFEVLSLPPMYNAHNRQHWGTKQKEKNNWTRLVGDSLYGKIPPTPFQFYTLRLCRHSSSEPDYDGLVSSWKYVVDALRYYKIIVDDKLSNSGPWICEWVKAPRNQQKISVTIQGYPELQLKSGSTV